MTVEAVSELELLHRMCRANGWALWLVAGQGLEEEQPLKSLDVVEPCPPNVAFGKLVAGPSRRRRLLAGDKAADRVGRVRRGRGSEDRRLADARRCPRRGCRVMALPPPAGGYNPPSYHGRFCSQHGYYMAASCPGCHHGALPFPQPPAAHIDPLTRIAAALEKIVQHLEAAA